MRFLLLILTFSTYVALAQQPTSEKPKKWAIGLSYSPDFCYRVSYEKSSLSALSNIDEKGKLGFTAGANILYQLLDKVGIEFGILYNTKGEKVHAEAFSWYAPATNYDPSIPNSGQSEYITSPETKTNFSYQYLEIPLKVNVYLFSKNKLKLFPSIGCSANIFMGKKTATTFIYEDGHKEKNVSREYDRKNIPGSEFALLVGVGASYDLSERLFVKLEPSFRTFIRPLVDSPISGTFYSLGANAGIYLKF
jgi:opacity protein-like surface antigen